MTPAKQKVKTNRKKEREATDPSEYDFPGNTESEGILAYDNDNLLLEKNNSFNNRIKKYC